MTHATPNPSTPNPSTPSSPPVLSPGLLERLQLVMQGQHVPDHVRAFAARWYGPNCTRVEVVGESGTDYDDERTYEYGSVQVNGYDAQGTDLPELCIKGGESEETTYWEALADYQAGVASGEIDPEEDDAPEPEANIFDNDGTFVIEECYVSERSGLSAGYYHLGDPASTPYSAELQQIELLGRALQSN